MDQPSGAYSGDGSYSFVCYAHEDTALVYPEITWMQGEGINIWYDEGVSPGEEWTEELGRAIEKADRFIYFVTPASVASRHCRNEVHFAQKHGKPILVVYLQPTTLPSGLELIVGSSQAILKHELREAVYRDKLGSALRRASPAIRALSVAAQTERRWLSWSVLAVGLTAVFAGIWWYAKLPDESAHDEHTSQDDAQLLTRSVVIEPFTTVGATAADEALVIGLVDELRTAVSKYPELQLIADGGSASYALGGSVVRAGDNLRLRVHLERGTDVVWSSLFDIDIAKNAAGITDRAIEIGRFMRLQLVQDQQCEAVRRKAESADAARYYCLALKENYRWNQGGLQDMAVQLANAQRAVELDPNLGEAYVLWADALGSLGDTDRAREVVQRGLTLLPDDARLLFLRARQRAGAFAYTAARADLERAIAVDPAHPNVGWFHGELGRISFREGKLDEAIEHYRRAVRADDANARIYVEYAAALYEAAKYRDALAVAEAAWALTDSGDYKVVAGTYRARALLRLGDREAANRAIDQSRAIAERDVFPLVAVLAIPLAETGRLDEVRAIYQELSTRTDVPPWLMFLSAWFVDSDSAFRYLYEDVDAGGLLIPYMRVGETFTEMRKDPRWADVMRHLETREAEGAKLSELAGETTRG